MVCTGYFILLAVKSNCQTILCPNIESETVPYWKNSKAVKFAAYEPNM